MKSAVPSYDKLLWPALRAVRHLGHSAKIEEIDEKVVEEESLSMGVYRLSLVSFPVFFQCKRYKGSVTPDKVRDFRGAMAGRGDKGLLITTGTFTAEAKKEATREGAPPIDLIDGERLCDLLKEHQLGVTTTLRTIEEIKVNPEFFGSVLASN